jgi:hypothetical protein
VELRHQLGIAPRHETGEFRLGWWTDIEKQLLHRAARIRQSFGLLQKNPMQAG